jgi:hypothetical protein
VRAEADEGGAGNETDRSDAAPVRSEAVTSDPDRGLSHASPQVAVQNNDAETQPLSCRLRRLARRSLTPFAARSGRSGQQQEGEGGD